MRLLYIGAILFLVSHREVRGQQDTKQINLEDIEKDNLASEKSVELLQAEQSQSVQQSSEDAQAAEKGESKESSQNDIRYAPAPTGYETGPAPGITYVTPSAPAALEYIDPKINLGQQYQPQYGPQVHESDITYTVPARQSLVKPIIGGGAPILPGLAPQLQYVYVTAPGGNGGATAPAINSVAAASKTLYQQEQQSQQRHFSSLYGAPSAPAEQQYVMFYPYQQQQHIVSPQVPPPVVSVPSPAVYSLSHGTTGLDSFHASTARPFLFDSPSFVPLSASYGASSKSVLPLPLPAYKGTPKYHTTIEPQVVLGPFSLPPTLEYTAPSGGSYHHHNTLPLPHPYPKYDLSFVPSYSKKHTSLDSSLPAPYSPLKVKVTTPFGHSAPSSYFPNFYNTISYSVPYSGYGVSKYKRNSGK